MNRRLAASTAALLAFAAGCAGTVPATHYYVLEARDVVAGEHADRDGLTIGVETFRVDPPYDQDRIVYRVKPGTAEVGFYAYHRWAVPLARMLPQVVAGGLEGVPGVHSIEPASAGRAYEAKLSGRLLVLEEIGRAGSPAVRVRVELRLASTDGTEIWSRLLARELPIGSDSVASVVDAMRTALSEELRDSRDDLGRTLGAR